MAKKNKQEISFLDKTTKNKMIEWIIDAQTSWMEDAKSYEVVDIIREIYLDGYHEKGLTEMNDEEIMGEMKTEILEYLHGESEEYLAEQEEWQLYQEALAQYEIYKALEQ